jgi:hypothetical protein
MEIHRRARDEFFRDLPAAEDDKALYWECPPNDESDYISFVEYVLRRASLADPEEEKSAPFQTGLRDGAADVSGYSRLMGADNQRSPCA